MIMRRRPLLRAAAVAGGAYIAGKRVANRRAEDQQVDSPPAPNEAATAGDTGTSTAEPSAASISDQLNQLTDLHSQGTLTDEEFTAAKAKLLGI